MGLYRPKSSNPYVPDSLKTMKEQISEAIAAEIEATGVKSPDVAKRVPSCRASNFTDFKDGFGDRYGMARLIKVAEALGLRVELHIKGRTA